MNAKSMGNYKWSQWYRLGDEAAKCKMNVRDIPGVYEIRTNFEFGRLRGKSQILSIGKAKSLYQRLCKGRLSDLVKNLDRPEKWLYNADQIIEFHYTATASEEEAKWIEALRQWEYENKHWELPPGNDKLEKAPILKRIGQKYPGFNEKTLKGLLEEYQTTDKVASLCGVPPFIIENLIVYWMIETDERGSKRGLKGASPLSETPLPLPLVR